MAPKFIAVCSRLSGGDPVSMTTGRASVAGFFFGRLTGGEWIGAMGVILSLYGAANVLTKKVGNGDN